MKTLTIHGVAKSYAEIYAKEKGISFVADAAARDKLAAPVLPTQFTDVAASSPFVDAIK